MSGFQVGVAALTGPAQRLKQISVDLAMAASGAATAAGSAGPAAGDPAVVGAADVFETGVQSALAALGDDAGLIGDKLQRAGVTYEVTDQNAMPPGQSVPGVPAPGGDPSGAASPGSAGPATQPATQPEPATPPEPATVRVAPGDSLWAIASGRLGPDATPAAVSAEVCRWYEANRAEIGPDPDLLRSGATLRAPQGKP